MSVLHQINHNTHFQEKSYSLIRAGRKVWTYLGFAGYDLDVGLFSKGSFAGCLVLGLVV
jgi:hypothetical protein